jgi:hypothetical protein
MSFNASVRNYTRFVADKFVLPTADGQEALVALVNGTFDVRAGALYPAEAQRPILVADEYYADSVPSSIRYESQLAINKPFVDVLVRGHVYSPGGRRATQVQASLEVGPIQKTLVAMGDRFWKRGPFGIGPSAPQAFERIPVVYERSFGGAVGGDIHASNPVGVGYRQARSLDDTVATEVPNFEYPNARVNSPADKTPPAGFGVIARHWQPRVRYAGTFGPEWLANRWPLLPTDFDARYAQAAPSDQQLASLHGGEAVTLVNLSQQGEVRFNLPMHRFAARFVYRREVFTRQMRLDTVLIEPDDQIVTLTWRASVISRRRLGLLRKIIMFDEAAW